MANPKLIQWPTDYSKEKALHAQAAAKVIRDAIQACLKQALRGPG